MRYLNDNDLFIAKLTTHFLTLSYVEYNINFNIPYIAGLLFSFNIINYFNILQCLFKSELIY